MRKQNRRKPGRGADLSNPAAPPRLLPPDADTGSYGSLIIGGSHLSAGTVIHATVRARVLGFNLLRLEAIVEAAPAQLTKLQQLLAPPGGSARPHEMPARQELKALSGQRFKPLPKQERAIGSKLNEALSYLNEGAASLAAANEHRPPPQRQSRTRVD